ncbi:MAG: hypothetical protein ACYS5V_06570, partial [Planctomycetota bacterium]
MPHRLIGAWAVLLGVVGVLVIAALVVLGRDLRQASVTGPRWKRRLVAAAMGLLGMIGSAQAAPPSRPAANLTTKPAATAPSRTPLRESKDWKEISYAWLRTGAVASGGARRPKLGQKGRDALLNLLPRVERLRRSGSLSAAEAEAVKTELTVLADAVHIPPPTRPEGPMTEEQERKFLLQQHRTRLANMEPAWESVPRAKRRTGALKTLADARIVRREVYLHLLATVAPEAVLLRKEWSAKPGKRWTEGDLLARQLDALLDRIGDRTPP